MESMGKRLRSCRRQQYRRRKRRGPAASGTVEASYVMAIVMLSLSLLIRTAYERCRENTGVMRLHHMVELARCREEEEETEISLPAINGKVLRRGDTVCGAAGRGWQKEIEAKVHRPENRMRLLTVFDGMTEGGRNDDGT